jgi:hypothetical protein
MGAATINTVAQNPAEGRRASLMSTFYLGTERR